jgi:N-acetylglucosamine malate deacetylase 2
MTLNPGICFAAHPDDETIGAGAHLPAWRDVRVVHATDGAPLNMFDANNYGFSTREAYAAARHHEVLCAMQIAGIGPDRVIDLGFVDQDACRHLTDLTRRIGELFLQFQPACVLAPPYEGGHPDHDSLAFAVHAAARMLERDGRRAPAIVEYALYNAGPGGIASGDFLPFPGAGQVKVLLDRRAAALKARMVECFVTQRQTLSKFRTVFEMFRTAPRYDFAAPPHAGKLFYEHFDWGVTGEEWRLLARDAASVLGVSLA